MSTNIKIIETASGFIGKLKYIFGSDNITGGSGDCSSFTEYVFGVHGYEIGADTSAQYSQGLPVGIDSLEPGDLVFFKNTYNSNKIDGVSHVGIYRGNDEFIHLSSSGCKVSSLNETYWQEHYLDARRVVGIKYEDYSIPSTDAETVTPITTDNLVWWGDIVRVVVIFLLIIGAIVFMGVGVGKNIIKEV